MTRCHARVLQLQLYGGCLLYRM
eukprot:COSAG05_NODE_23179_length_259_cov_1.606250_1_plen_22_part_01